MLRYGFGTDTGVARAFHGYFEHGRADTDGGIGSDPDAGPVAATGNAAEFLGAKDLGTLEAGKWADLVVLQRDLWPQQQLPHDRIVYIAGQSALDERFPRPRCGS